MNTVPVPNDSFNWLLASIEFFIVAKEAFKFEFKFEALNCKAWKTSVTLVACSLDIPKFLPKSVVIWSKSNKALIIDEPTNENDTAKNSGGISKSPNKTREYYRKNLPVNDTLIKKSNKKIIHE